MARRAMLAEARAIDRAAERLIEGRGGARAAVHADPRDRASEAGLIGVGAQDCHAAEGGAHTGDISAAMLKDAGRRLRHRRPQRAARRPRRDRRRWSRPRPRPRWPRGSSVIVCVGETEAQRDAGKAEAVVAGQLDGSLPRGETARRTSSPSPTSRSGRSAPAARRRSTTSARCTARSARELVDASTARAARDVRILYGGSVKPENAAELLAADEVGGALVGGASLTAESFLGDHRRRRRARRR